MAPSTPWKDLRFLDPGFFLVLRENFGFGLLTPFGEPSSGSILQEVWNVLQGWGEGGSRVRQEPYLGAGVRQEPNLERLSSVPSIRHHTEWMRANKVPLRYVCAREGQLDERIARYETHTERWHGRAPPSRFVTGRDSSVSVRRDRAN